MRYEEYHNVGEVSKTREFEGSPEEIAQLINILKEPEQKKPVVNFNPSITITGVSDPTDISKAVHETLCKAFKELRKTCGNTY